MSVGLEVTSVDFNENNDKAQRLLKSTFEGIGNNFTVGVAAASASYGYSTSPGRFTMNLFTKDKMYSSKGGAVSIGAGGTLGGMWQGSRTILRK